MLMKLMKHEFRATGRIMLPMYLILLVTAVGANLATKGFLSSRYPVVEVIYALLAISFGFAIFGVFILSFVLMLQRFYKNLLQDEGYLMLTLPVSIHQHIWAKLIVSSVWFIATMIMVTLASMIMAYDVRVLREVPGAISIFFHGMRLLSPHEALNGSALLIESGVLFFLMLVAFCLQFYAALAAGHSLPAHKMAASVAFFFVFLFAIIFLGSSLMIAADEWNLFHFEWDPDPLTAVHVAMLIANGFVVAYGAIFYGITTFFLKRRLNLE